ncbi:MAG: thioredoxin domain-containing protein [Bdellovibrionales bacterium]|nr:thioredoxin domain-containing protein [Bdellovibrionales bacterium]
MNSSLWFAALGLAAIGLLLSLYSSYEYIHVLAFPLSGEASCNINAQFNCEQAIRSPFAAFLNRSLGNWGALFYASVLFFLFFYNPERAESPKRGLSVFLIVCLLSSLCSVSLFVITVKTLDAFCPVCIGLYAVSFLLLAVVFGMERDRSLGERLKVGVVNGLTIPYLAASFLIEQIRTQLFSARAPLLIFSLAILAVSLFSDLLSYKYLKATENMDERAAAAVQLWLAEPLQDIPFEGEDPVLRDFRKGDPNSAIRIVEFFDFECPACRQFYYEIKDVLSEFGDHVIIEYRNYPLDSACNPGIGRSFHQYACEAAEFARCAGEQDRYFEASDYLLTLEAMDNPESPVGVSDAIRAGINRLDLDKAKMDECLQSDRQILALRRDIEVADTLKLRGTPSIWINGRLLKNRSLLRDVVSYLVKKEQGEKR